jgi:hypothetical protein
MEALERVTTLSDSMPDDEGTWSPYDRSQMQRAIDDVFVARDNVKDAGLWPERG